MNRTLSALFSALEAVIVVGVGLAIPLLPLTVLWGAQYGFAPDWTIFWRVSADTWLLGHGTDLTLTLDPATAKSLALAGAGSPFVVSMAALGFALLTLILGRRAGLRIAETHHRLLGEVVALLVFALLATGITFSAGHAFARPDLAQGITLPTLVFVLGILLARLGTIPDLTRRLGPALRATIDTALRGGAIAATFVISIAAIIVIVLLLGNYAQIITLYENLHSGGLGGLELTIAQIMILPNLVIWAASWLVGPGFAIGSGSTVSPLGTTLGPLPSIPVLGALPHADFAYAFVGIVVPILAGFVTGAVLRGSLSARIGYDNRIAWMAAAGLGTGIVGGVIMGLLAWAAAGSIGPGRLQQVGPDPLMVGLWAALEIGVAAAVGLATASQGTSGRGRARTR
jgi:hypothetical protein